MTSLNIDKIINKHYIFFVDKESPAFDVCRRVSKERYKPGMIIPVSKKELKSLGKDLLVVQVRENA